MSRRRFPVTAWYRGEEMTVRFKAMAERDERGLYVEDIEVEDLEILGKDRKMADLPKDLQSDIESLADGLDWEPSE